MKSLASLSSISCLGLIFLTATPSFGTVVSNLEPFHNPGLTVLPDGIWFSLDNASSGSASAASDASPRATPDLLSAGGNFPPSGSNSSSDAGGSNPGCALVAKGDSCAIQIGTLASPIILTYLGPGFFGGYSGPNDTTALLGVSGPGKWTGGLQGLFIDENSQTDLTSLHFVKGGFSGGTVPPTDPTPEPRAISAVALAGLLVGIAWTKRRRIAL
jgi:hypothetical protein